MLTRLQAIRPQLKRHQNYEEAVDAVDDMFRSVQKSALGDIFSFLVILLLTAKPLVESEDNDDGSDEGSDEERDEDLRLESDEDQEDDSASDSSVSIGYILTL